MYGAEIDNVSVKHEASDTSALFYYDSENMMTHANIDGIWSYYAYDFAGRRVKKQVGTSPAVITTYCYDDDQVIAEYEGDTLKRKFIYGPGIDEPICMSVVLSPESEVRYYYHYDGLGSVVALTNSSGNIVEQYSYDVFGKPNTTSSIGNPYMFTGRRYDSETDLYYYRARYYHPEIGRFLQPDPIHYLGGWNLYKYCKNNPANWIDPFGLKDRSPDKNTKKKKKVGPATPIDKKNPKADKNAYNCHSYTWHNSQGDPTDPRNKPSYVPPRWDQNPDDDLGGYDKLNPDIANRPGDRVIYGIDENGDGVLEGLEIQHSAIVIEVDSDGFTTRVESKWGEGPLYEHHPHDVPDIYGDTRTYYRESESEKDSEE